jgi:hypothetical protein
MKSKSFQGQNQKLSSTTRPAAAEELKPNKIGFAPPAHEVASRAYSHFLNLGSQHGHDVDDWLEAEAQLQEEHNLIRVGGGVPNQR